MAAAEGFATGHRIIPLPTRETISPTPMAARDGGPVASWPKDLAQEPRPALGMRKWTWEARRIRAAACGDPDSERRLPMGRRSGPGTGPPGHHESARAAMPEGVVALLAFIGRAGA